MIYAVKVTETGKLRGKYAQKQLAEEHRDYLVSRGVPATVEEIAQLRDRQPEYVLREGKVKPIK